MHETRTSTPAASPREARASVGAPVSAAGPAPQRADGLQGGGHAAEADFVFTVGDYGASVFKVTAFTGDEGISTLFRFEVELCTDESEIDMEEQLGRSCLLRLAGEAPAGGRVFRYVNGIVDRIELLGDGSSLTHYAISVVPIHSYLTKRCQSRIFQTHNCEDMSVPGIIRKVFIDAGMPDDCYRFSLQQTYEPREYVVQYREADMDFAARMMEEEGIFFFFEHTDDGHCMVIGDGDVACATDPDAPNAVFREATGLAADVDHVFSLRERRQIQTGAVTLDDFDFKRPPVELRTNATAERFSALELSDYPGKYVDKPLGDRYASVRLEEKQCARHTLEVATTVRAFKAGYRFSLQEHPASRLNEEYLVTRIRHVGRQSQSAQAEALSTPQRLYEAELSVIPARVPYRPTRSTPRPAVRGSQTAIVVGPQAEEIFTDEYGRVKVQFHWDREGVYDENSSCWIRVSQGLAGGNYGAIFLPRVGQEVIVDFMEGDPDRPIITGRVYNKDHMPPYTLPDQKTQGGIRTRTSPGGGGGNEIRFEDAKDREQFFLHASRDMHVRARHDQFETVQNCRHAIVSGNDYERVDKSRHSHVKLDLVQNVDGGVSLKVAGDVGEDIKGNHSEEAANYYLRARENLVIEAGAELTLKVGGNFVKIDSSGVTILGAMVDINSGGSAGAGTVVALKELEAPAEALETEFGHDTRYDQAPSAPEPIEPDDTKTSWIEIELIDDLGEPVKGEAFEVVEPDQDVQRGFLDSKGQAHVAVSQPGLCQISFPNLDAAAWERI